MLNITVNFYYDLLTKNKHKITVNFYFHFYYYLITKISTILQWGTGKNCDFVRYWYQISAYEISWDTGAKFLYTKFSWGTGTKFLRTGFMLTFAIVSMHTVWHFEYRFDILSYLRMLHLHPLVVSHTSLEI